MKNIAILKDKAGKIRHAAQIINNINQFGKMIYFEIAGSPVQRRAFWANVVKYRNTRSRTKIEIETEIDGERKNLYIQPGEKFHKIETKNRLILVHENFNKFQRNCIIGGSREEAAANFADALQANIDLPFLKKWIPELWTEGIRRKLINPLESKTGGTGGWTVKSDDDSWQRLLKFLHGENRLK